MASLEEVFSMAASGPDYIHDDVQFLIDEDLRTIAIPPRGVVLGVTGDKDVNRVNFQMPLYYNGFDMSTFSIRVDFVNASGESGISLINDKTIEDDILYFTWLVDELPCRYVGNVTFAVRLIRTDAQGVIQKAFHTTINTAKVLEGLVVTDPITPEQATDLLERMRIEILEKASEEAAKVLEEVVAIGSEYPNSRNTRIRFLGSQEKDLLTAEDLKPVTEKVEQLNSDLDHVSESMMDIIDLLPSKSEYKHVECTIHEKEYIRRTTALPVSSNYSNWTEIDYIGGDYRVTFTSPNNSLVVPVLYVDSNNNILGYEPESADATVILTDYVLTIPSNTAKIYINLNPASVPIVERKTIEFLPIATKEMLSEKQDVLKAGKNISIDKNVINRDVDVSSDAMKYIPYEASSSGIMPFTPQIKDGYYIVKTNLSERNLNVFSYATIFPEENTTYYLSISTGSNSAFCAVLYIDSENHIIGEDPAEEVGDFVWTRHELTVPRNTAKIYVSYKNNGTHLFEKEMIGEKTYLKCASEKYVDEKIGIDFSKLTCNAVGDSITYQHRYIDKIKELIGLNFNNYGIGSTTIAKNDTYMSSKSIVERICGLNGNVPIADADFWIVMGGLNDNLYRSPLGVLSSYGSNFDITTVYGALQKICEYILSLKAEQHLFLMTPSQSVRDAYSESSYPTTMSMIRQAVIDVGAYYAIPVFDVHGECGVSIYNCRREQNPTTSDGVHPNELGGSMMGKYVARKIVEALRY